MKEVYGVLHKGRIAAVTDFPGLQAFKPEYRQSAILLDPIQVPCIIENLQGRGGISSSNMPTQFLECIAEELVESGNFGDADLN